MGTGTAAHGGAFRAATGLTYPTGPGPAGRITGPADPNEVGPAEPKISPGGNSGSIAGLGQHTRCWVRVGPEFVGFEHVQTLCEGQRSGAGVSRSAGGEQACALRTASPTNQHKVQRSPRQGVSASRRTLRAGREGPWGEGGGLGARRLARRAQARAGRQGWHCPCPSARRRGAR